MNQAEYLCHSSGPWKKHKYFQKIGEGANAVYRYAKSAAENPGSAVEDAANNVKNFYNKNITGDEYKAREWAAKENAKYSQHLAENAAKEGRTEAANRSLKESERYGRKAAKAEHDYSTKSVKGVAETTARKAKQKIDNFGSSTKVTVTDMKTGETRTPNKNGGKLYNIRKKKFLKHDDFSSSVANGEAIINNLFNKR